MVLSGEDLLNGLTMQSAVQGFVQWFLDQEVEEPDDNDGTWLWYDIKPMVNMWNKFVSKNNPAPMPSDTQDPFSDIFESVTGKASGSRTKKSRKSKKKTTN